MWTGSRWRTGDGRPPMTEPFSERRQDIVSFVGELRDMCDDYFTRFGKPRAPNYEDIAYIARQLEDGLRSEYETRHISL